jgi:hypothetical protein
MTTLSISSAYRGAVMVAIVLQVVTTLLLLTILDGRTMARAGGAAMVGFWVGVGMVMLRRPRTPGRMDLLYVRWGYLILLIVGVALSPYMGAMWR